MKVEYDAYPAWYNDVDGWYCGAPSIYNNETNMYGRVRIDGDPPKECPFLFEHGILSVIGKEDA